MRIEFARCTKTVTLRLLRVNALYNNRSCVGRTWQAPLAYRCQVGGDTGSV